MIDKDVVESAYLAAQSRFLQIVQSAEEAWEAGDTALALQVIDEKLTNLPSDVKERSRALNPLEWDALEKRITTRRMQNGTN